MKQRKIALIAFIAIALMVFATSCGKKTTAATTETKAAEEKPLTFTWASQNNPLMATGQASIYTVEEIDRLSNGMIKVEYHDNGKLGYDAELIQQVVNGTIPVVTIGIGTFSQYTDVLEAIQLPFLITDYDLEYEVVQSAEFKALLEEAGSQLGLKIIGAQENGIRHFANNVRPINTVEDLKGLSLRVPQTTMLTKTIKALGANPIPLAYNEIYTGLQNKVVDGEEVNFTSMDAQKHYEVVKYASVIGFYPYMAVTAINLKFWNSLTAEQQQIIEQALLSSEEKMFTGMIQKNDEEAQAHCAEEGVQINTIQDVDSFRSVISDLYTEYKGKSALVKTFIESVEAKQK